MTAGTTVFGRENARNKVDADGLKPGLHQHSAAPRRRGPHARQQPGCAGTFAEGKILGTLVIRKRRTCRAELEADLLCRQVGSSSPEGVRAIRKKGLLSFASADITIGRCQSDQVMGRCRLAVGRRVFALVFA